MSAHEERGTLIPLGEGWIEAAMRNLENVGYAVIIIGPGALVSGLPPASPIDIEATRASRDPDLSILRRRAARAFAATRTGHSAGAIEIRHSANGAPAFAPQTEGLHLSFAGRAGVALIGLATCPVGVDLETRIPAEAIPWNVLRADEVATLRALHGAVRAEAFTRLWTGKEAALKLLGTGLHRPPESIRIEADGRIHLDPSGADAPTREKPDLRVCFLVPDGVFHNISSVAVALLRDGRSDPH